MPRAANTRTSSISQLDILPIEHVVVQIKQLDLYNGIKIALRVRSHFYLIIIEFAALQMKFIIMRDYHFRWCLCWRRQRR